MATFDEKCKFCGEELDLIWEEGKHSRGIHHVFWCPQCGALLQWYCSFPIKDSDWKQPGKQQ